MSKYIIDIPDNVKKIVYFHVGNANAVWTTSNDLDDLETLTADYINEHFSDLLQDEYDRGYKDGRNVTETQAHDDAYKRGLEEGGEQMPCDTCAYRHNNLLCADCKWTYGSRYKVDSIGVGDVVKTYNGITFVVTKATTDGIVVGFEGEGNTCRFALSEVTKTGEHYNINEILGGLSSDN